MHIETSSYFSDDLNGNEKDCIRVVSFQDKNVLDIILSKGEYRCSFISNYNRQAPILYDLCSELLENKTGIKSIPIFGWERIVTSDGVISRDRLSDSSSILLCNSKVPSLNSTCVMLELDIPSNNVVLQDFLDFACFKADEEEELCGYSDLRKFIYSDSYSDLRDIQAIFPLIKLEWLSGAYKLNIEYDKEFSKYLKIKCVSKIKLY